MLGSYNEALSTTFSKNVRDTITEQKGDEDKVVYSEIFPNVMIKYGDSAMNKWSLENGYNNYLATSPKGTSTGFGATLMIIDDLIKSALEANNADVLEQQWTWFTDTMLSRLEEGGKIIIIMTRWHDDDLAGRALRHFTKLGMKVRHICYKALQDDGTMLCPEILSRRSYEVKTKSMSKEIAAANYQQEPINIKGRLYSKFKTYTKLPMDENGNPLYTRVKNYTDTADTGDDFLCSIDYVEYNQEAYVINVIYTKDSMEITEPAVAKMLFDDGVNDADIESNNGGRGFARNVETLLLEKFHSNKCIINPFYQDKNKQSRILSNSTWVMNHIYFLLIGLIDFLIIMIQWLDTKKKVKMHMMMHRMLQQELQKRLDKVIHLALIKGMIKMEVMKQIERVMNQVEKIDYKSVYIEIATQNDKFIIDKTKPKNRIGFKVKGGE